MDEYSRSYILKQQTPMIHFQYNEQGVCLRASEVKPKLDRFIIKWLERKSIQIPQDWYISKEHPALNYKMRIHATAAPRDKVEKGINFFANELIKDDKEKKHSIFWTTGEVELKIICLCKNTHNKIGHNFLQMLDSEKIIEHFFATQCFGTRQTKGYGYFLVKESQNLSNEQVEKYLCDVYPGGVWKIKLTNSDPAREGNDFFDRISLDINWVYSLMKAGVNTNTSYQKGFIFKYFLKNKEIGNEKAYMKWKFPDTVHSNPKRPQHTHEVADPSVSSATTFQCRGCNTEHTKVYDQKQRHEYVRGLLGVAEKYEFSAFTKEGKKISVPIAVSGRFVERFASPVLFRYDRDTIYIIAGSIPPVLSGQEFQFSDKNNSAYTIKMPELYDAEKAPDGFSLTNFLDQFAGRFNELDDRVKIRTSYFTRYDAKKQGGPNEEKKQEYSKWAALRIEKVGEKND